MIYFCIFVNYLWLKHSINSPFALAIRYLLLIVDELDIRIVLYNILRNFILLNVKYFLFV